MAVSNTEAHLYKSVEELAEPIKAKLIGDIPTWISGTLLRNGPGKFEVGDTAYRHVYDGLALLQQFVIENGEVTYFNRFLRSQTYQTNMKAGKIVEGELGTPASPDPCKNIFARWFTYFFPKDYTDNASVNFCCIQGKIYATTEVPIITEVDPSSLETLNRVHLSDAFRGTEVRGIYAATAHPHEDRDGFTYNLSLGYEKKIGLSYLITKLPCVVKESDSSDDGKPVQGGEIVAVIPASYHHAYSHSFGMTEKYFIFIQQPLTVSLWKIGMSRFFGLSILDSFSWCPTKPTIFHVICRTSGDVVATFSADTFFFFHVANAYDLNGNIILDICCYENPSILFELYAKEYRCSSNCANLKRNILSYLRRYTLPVKEATRTAASDTFHSQIPKLATGNDFEILSAINMELPQINEKYNMLPYRFAYGVSRTGSGENSSTLFKLVKIDIEETKTTIWSEEQCSCSEPVFISAPDSQEEEEGVILSTVYDVKNAKSFLLVLDGRSFTEIGRAEVPLRFAPSVHGVFLPSFT